MIRHLPGFLAILPKAAILMIAAILVAAAILLTACAQPHRVPSTSAPPVDALLPAGRNLFLFDFTQSRYQRWNLDPPCRLADTLRGPWSAHPNWLTLAAPGAPFAPVKVAGGPNGHFFLLDRIGDRVCLYDTNAQFLSCFPLPRELQDRNPERLQMHWTRDGIFSFLDLPAGMAWQFTEMRGSGGQGDWRLINRLRLPLNLESCLWEPFFPNPCCRAKARNDSVSPGNADMVCFDKYFNSRGGGPVAGDSSSADPYGKGPESGWDRDLEVRPDPAGKGWLLVLTAGRGCGEGTSPARYCFHSEKGRLAPCPQSMETSGPAGR